MPIKVMLCPAGLHFARVNRNWQIDISGRVFIHPIFALYTQKVNWARGLI